MGGREKGKKWRGGMEDEEIGSEWGGGGKGKSGGGSRIDTRRLK